jgi:Ca2+-binding EF-hand superfamily protein
MDVMINALTEMRRNIVSNRILLKPSFQDFDRTKSCHVTNQQFQRVLKSLGIHPAREQIFDLIIRKYLDKGNTREVNYFSFCADVDRPEDMFPQLAAQRAEAKATANKAAKSASYFYAGPTRDINVLENRFL